MVTYDDNTFDSQANYSCSVGYTLNGNTTRVCQADGQWSGSEPICEGQSVIICIACRCRLASLNPENVSINCIWTSNIKVTGCTMAKVGKQGMDDRIKLFSMGTNVNV